MATPIIPQNTAAPLDPITSLLDYIAEVKPYHTKIIETLIQYNYNDTLSVSITEDVPDIEVTITEAPALGNLASLVGFGGIAPNIIQTPSFSSPPVILSQATAPTSPSNLDLWFDTTANQLKQWSSPLWNPISVAYWLTTDTMRLYATIFTLIPSPSVSWPVDTLDYVSYSGSALMGIYGWNQGGFNSLTGSASGADSQTAATFSEDLTFSWGSLDEWFQYFIVKADSGTSTFTLDGNAVTQLQPGEEFIVVGSPIKGILTHTLTNIGSGYTPGTYLETPLSYVTSGTGSGAYATIIVNGSGQVTSVTITSNGSNYTTGDVLTTLDVGSGTDFTITVDSVAATGNNGRYRIQSSTYVSSIDQTLIVIDPVPPSNPYNLASVAATLITIPVTDTGGFIESTNVVPMVLNLEDTIGVVVAETTEGGITGATIGSWDTGLWDVGGYDGDSTVITL